MTRPNLSPPRLRPRTRFGTRRRAAARREPLPPAWRPAAARPRWSIPAPGRHWFGLPGWFLGSLLGHVLLALALYFWPDPRKPQDQLPPPSFDVVFEGGQAQQPEAEPAEGVPTEPEPPEPPATAEPPPPPDAPPQPGLPPPPPPSPDLPSPELPSPELPSPAPPTPAPPVPAPPVPAPPIPAPPVPAPPPPTPEPPLPPAELPPMEPAPLPPTPGTVELFAPQTDLRLPDRLAESLPPPPPPPPLAPPPAPPRPPQRPTPPAQQAQPPRPNLPGIWAPGGLQLGRPPTPPSGRPQARGLDLRVDPRLVEGQATRDPSVRVTGAQVGADWRAAFRRWLNQNVHYSQQAIMRGEDGQVRVRITASADGTVRNVQLVGPSTSPSLNFGTTYPFNGARLPSFPPGSDPNVVIDLTVNYVLIRGR